MPYRTVIFVRDEIYHIYNRGVARQPIFTSPKDYQRFIDLLIYYHHEPPLLSFSHYHTLPIEGREQYDQNLRKKSFLCDIFAFCLMPNHFHLLLKQNKTYGIQRFLTQLQNGYVRYYNTKHTRVGPLFQSMFKGVRIETDEEFLHVSRYIHLNPSTAYIVKPSGLLTYPWSSFPFYIKDGKQRGWVKTEYILGLMGDRKKYKEFVFDQLEYQRSLNEISHVTLEENP